MEKNIFEKNIKAMNKWYPEFANEVKQKAKKIKENSFEDIKINNIFSFDGKPIVYVEKGGKSFYLGGKRNATEPVEIWRERIGKIHNYSPIILMGLGNGSYLKKILEDADKSIYIVAYEPSLSLFINLLEQTDISKEIESRPIAFIVNGMNEEGLEGVLAKIITPETMSFVKEEIHPNYRELFPEEIVYCLRLINKITEFHIVNYNTGQKFSTVLAKNLIHNAKYLLDGYNTKKLFEAIPHDQPGILVSAGPSLNDNIEQLKSAKNKAFILAVDTAVKPLLKAGIKPDAYITIDALKSLQLFDDDRIYDIPIITPLVANSEVIKRQKGKKIFYFDDYLFGMEAYMSAGKVLPPVDTGGSVACSGLSLLFKMGFDPIILVGQDLALTNNRTHADGTFEEHMPEENVDNSPMVKGNYVDKIATRTDFKMYLDWFKDYIAGMKLHQGTRVINATAGGAYIDGTELMKLDEAVEKYCTREVDYESCIENMESEFNEKERDQVVDYLHSVPNTFIEIKTIADSLYKEYKRIYNMGKNNHVDSKAYLKALKKIKKYTKKCEDILLFSMIECSTPLAEYILRSESLLEQQSLEEEARTIGQQGMLYCDIIKQCADILREYAEVELSTLR